MLHHVYTDDHLCNYVTKKNQVSDNTELVTKSAAFFFKMII